MTYTHKKMIYDIPVNFFYINLQTGKKESKNDNFFNTTCETENKKFELNTLDLYLKHKDTMSGQNKEIERKFLVTSDKWKGNVQGVLYRQAYLSIEPERTVRVRLEGEAGKLTIKGIKENGAGDEFEYDIPGDEAVYLIDHICLKPVIEKMRYKINLHGNIWEVDEFFGENLGLVLAEIELNSVDQKFDRPDWIGEDVTEEPKYKNASLVKYPFNRW